MAAREEISELLNDYLHGQPGDLGGGVQTQAYADYAERAAERLAAELDALRAVAEAARAGIPWLTDDIESLRDSVARPSDGVIDDDADAGMVAEAEAVLRRIAGALAAFDKVREAGG